MLIVLLYLPLLIAVICGYAVMYYREIMLAEIEAEVDLKSRMRFPRLNWNFPEVMRMHNELYPVSHIGQKVRLLTRILIGCVAISMAVMFISAFLHSAA